MLNPFVSIISLPIMTILISIITKLYQIIAVSSPFILFGFLIAGVLHVMLHESLFRRVFGREGVMPLLRAVGLGSLIPICSCGVVPIGVGAYKSGAGTGTVLAFMTAAPALSPASVLLSIKLLGLELAGWQIGSVVVGSFLLGLI
ncbi:MAG: permease, partial [Planctomycetaceae bacterium]|nr:permease [Planctomycetaceae bacterium]